MPCSLAYLHQSQNGFRLDNVWECLFRNLLGLLPLMEMEAPFGTPGRRHGSMSYAWVARRHSCGGIR